VFQNSTLPRANKPESRKINRIEKRRKKEIRGRRGAPPKKKKII